MAGLEYSIFSTPIGDGPLFEPKFIWALNFPCGGCNPSVETIEAMYSEFDRLRRTQPYTSAEILLTDTNQKYVEKSPRTRAIAPAPNNAADNLSGGYIAYYAKFKTWMVKAPEFDDLGRYRACTLTLQETEKVSA